MVKLHSVVQARLTEVVDLRDERGQRDIGEHAAVLGAVTVRSIELLLRDLKLPNWGVLGSRPNSRWPRSSRLCTVPLPWVDFAATMPEEIDRLIRIYLKDPSEWN